MESAAAYLNIEEIPMLAVGQNVFSIQTAPGIRLAFNKNARIRVQALVDYRPCVMCTTMWPPALVRKECRAMPL